MTDPRIPWLAPRLEPIGNGAADLERLAGCFDVAPASDPTLQSKVGPGAEPDGLELHLTHRQFCERVAADFYASSLDASGDAWADLAARIQRLLVGEFARFTLQDVALVGAMQSAAVRYAYTEGAAERRRACTKLGVLLVEAAAGRLPQLRGRL